MRVALVHDYLGEFGGAERVLVVLSQMYPKAPIYTAFYRKDSPAYERFKDRDIRASWAQRIPGFATRLHSPLRFLAPLIWESFNFDEFDLVISSASWYITKGILTRPETVHISYIHTPPRYLYGYETAVNWQKYWLLRGYARVVNHFLRKYDLAAAQRPDVLVANSENVRRRIKKFYGREAVVVYPPVSLPTTVYRLGPKKKAVVGSRSTDDYFLVVSRVVGGKGLELAVQACTELGVPLKVVGQPGGWFGGYKKLKEMAGPKVKFIGHVSDKKLAQLYAGAKAFLATARDEDFGITPVEAMLAGTPVIAYKGGGYLETVKDGVTGIFFDEYSAKALKEKISDFINKKSCFNRGEIKKQAKRFSKERFVKEMKKVVQQAIKEEGAVKDA